MAAKNFNSHAHVERDMERKVTVEEITNFNSHAHVERDILILLLLVEFSISTHTLTWSVTGEDGHVAIATGDFNSHAHVERDRKPPIYAI